MTEITLVKAKNGNALKCIASGHAGFAESGKDIVCSAVTVLMRTAMQVFSETSGIELKTDTSTRGNLTFTVETKKSDSVLQERVSAIGDFLKKGFESLSEEFPKNVTFELKLETNMGRTRGGSGAKNGRDSNPKHLGVKKYGGEVVTAGSIIVKQRGTHFHPGDNVQKAGDDSLFATVDGNVVYSERKNRKIVSVTPVKA